MSWKEFSYAYQMTVPLRLPVQNPAHFIYHLINDAGLFGHLRRVSGIAFRHAVDGMELFILLSDALRNILIDGYGSLN